jgi:hypothetical protein
LAASIAPPERLLTTIVFDAAGAPPGLPRTVIHDAMTVHYARDYADADAMLEELIDANHTPRSLVVVSSDHRVQRAARRRRAKAVDSDRWYSELWAARHRRAEPSGELPLKPDATLTTGEVDYWLKQFADESPAEKAGSNIDTTARQKSAATDVGLVNPFPPGYAEDELEEE